MSDPRSDDPFGGDPVNAEFAQFDEFDELDEFDAENLQMSTGGGMGPESFPPDDDEDFRGNGADRGPGG